MRKFKHLLTTLALGASLIASACWFGDNYTGNLEDNYIAYLSGDVVHYEVLSENSFKITNGQTVAMPFTVFIKVAPRNGNGEIGKVSSSGDGNGKITKAILQYKVCNGTEATAENGKDKWITVKEIDNPDWELNFDEPVALFGRDTINIPGITTETTILIRLYLTDGTYATGNLDEDIDEKYVVDVIGGVKDGHIGEDFTGVTYTPTNEEEVEVEESKPIAGSWTAPFVMKVKVKANSGSNKVVRPHR